jgi:hypothetical protein
MKLLLALLVSVAVVSGCGLKPVRVVDTSGAVPVVYSNIFEDEAQLIPGLVRIRAAAHMKPKTFSKKQPGEERFAPTSIDVYLYNEAPYRIPIKLGQVSAQRGSEIRTLYNESRFVTLVPSTVERLHMETDMFEQDDLFIDITLQCIVKEQTVTRKLRLKRLTVKDHKSRSKSFWRR